MITILRGFFLFTIISAAAAYIADGVYRITNDRYGTALHSAVYGSTCYLSNSTSDGTTDLHELWLVNFIPRAPLAAYTFQNLARQAYASNQDDSLISLYAGYRNAYTINDLDDGSYSIRTVEENEPGPEAWAAQPPTSHGFVKLVGYKEGHTSQKWWFESAFCDA